MTPSGEIVSPKTTLAVILGASDFPQWSALSNPAFEASAKDFRRYLLDEEAFNLPESQLLPLFNTSKSQSDILVDIATFLSEKYQPHGAVSTVRDLLIYYVGHGDFTAGRNYCLAVASSRPKVDATMLRMGDLAGVIRNNAAGLRRFLILDCCFAGKAIKEMQSAPLIAAREEIMDSFAHEGTTLLCSSTENKVSLAPEGSQYTMFSGALLEVLRTGVPNLDTPLSMDQLGNRTDEIIRLRYPGEAVRPTVLSPDPVAEKTSLVPFFPNAATRPRRLKEQVEEISSRLNQVSKDLETLGKWVKDLQNERSIFIADVTTRLKALEARPAAPAGDSEEKPESELERRTRVLRLAPPDVLEQLQRWRSARIAGLFWVMSVAGLVLASMLSLFYILRLGIMLRQWQNPLNWLPVSLLVWTTLLNGRKLLGRAATSTQTDKYPSTPLEWETLEEVIASNEARYFQIFGSVYVTSPWFEIADLVLFVQLVFFVLLSTR